MYLGGTFKFVFSSFDKRGSLLALFNIYIYSNKISLKFSLCFGLPSSPNLVFFSCLFFFFFFYAYEDGIEEAPGLIPDGHF